MADLTSRAFGGEGGHSQQSIVTFEGNVHSILAMDAAGQIRCDQKGTKKITF
jgi:hypothetical protein